MTSFRAMALWLGAYIAIFVGPLCGQTTNSDSNRPNATGSPALSSALTLPDSVKPAGSAANSSGSSAGLSGQVISAPSSYRLNTDDQIAIEVYGEDELRSAVRLNADGAVSLPLLGPVHLAGLTLNQAAARLTELYG